MKCTTVGLASTEAMGEAGRVALQPELLAATGARYSRNNEGLDAILSKIDFNNTDKSVDSIFRLLDYGHVSVLDMCPVSIFMDDISIFAAYYIFSISPTAGGQESSTRYIKMDVSGLKDPGELGIDEDEQATWIASMETAFKSYQTAVSYWESVAERNPSVIRLPESLLNDPSDKAQKQVERMKRNYVFDRSRYFIPLAAKTNMMLVQSARAWVNLIQHLASTSLKELQDLAAMLLEELSLVTPRLTKHAIACEATSLVLDDEFKIARDMLYMDLQYKYEPNSLSVAPKPFIEVFEPNYNQVTIDSACSKQTAINALKHRKNRYSLVGSHLSRTSVVFGWDAVSMAELRDLNRHRTGTKFAPLCPVGFYCAKDQVVEAGDWINEAFGQQMLEQSRDLLGDGDPKYIYYTLLGHQYAFEHTTTADKFIYEVELRTGTGAHYRYAKHFYDLLPLWYLEMPETKSLMSAAEGNE